MLTGRLNLLDTEYGKLKVELQQLRYSSQIEIESLKSVIKSAEITQHVGVLSIHCLHGSNDIIFKIISSCLQYSFKFSL
jgi:hypothetical protein